MAKNLDQLRRALQAAGCTARIGRHLVIRAPDGTSITIAGSPSTPNRKAVLADLASAGIDIDNKKIRRAIQRATR